MASLEEIKNKLNIVVGDRDIQEGMCKRMKNRYYNINNEYLVVEFKNDKHMVFSNDAKTRELLTNFVWCIDHGYPRNIGVGFFHQIYLHYEQGLVADHVNMLRYDNRQTNLRVVTYQQNSRNRTKQTRNISGKNGVYFNINQAWVAQIYNDNNQRIRKSFAINRYGDAEAKQMAIDQRELWEREFRYEGQ